MPILFILLVLIAGLLVLHLLFPDAVNTPDEYMRILYLAAVLVLVGGGWRISRVSGADRFRYASIWLMIILSLMLAHQLGQRYM